MTGKLEKDSRCPLCGGRLASGTTTIPFVFPETVVLVKDVPAEICKSCHEPYATGKVTDKLTDWMDQIRFHRPEVSIISYTTLEPTFTPD